jgi:hypothetical protein
MKVGGRFFKKAIELSFDLSDNKDKYEFESCFELSEMFFPYFRYMIRSEKK